ncbi:hypothetical protein P4493_28885 [Bacillus thuringiensis]|uniref:Uncharacterized protein n=1 Tax=Bacillus thuringiensis subsp. israelensis TaxID=1430 RepID=A0AAX3HHN0_BACTI|nr:MULTISPECIES: hypothetical protein [Bacillus]MED1154906.1 hypothetical protein [Bacillus paranthracis]AJH04538.1 hypothetical protein AS86_3675 [Bacillus thuringiensis HD1002]MBJ7937057.1 hypothetical protein [Bacillus cereus]MCC4013583.1 hypothetical protein [Bacillus thuringiensis]MCC4032804.1 hypothetical protein [Bacillus thuringiensis]
MTRQYETASMTHRELRAKFEMSKEEELRMSILKQIKDTLKKINKM